MAILPCHGKIFQGGWNRRYKRDYQIPVWLALRSEENISYFCCHPVSLSAWLERIMNRRDDRGSIYE